MFRDLITRGSFILYLELTSDINTDTSLISRGRNRARQEPILRDNRRVAQYAQERMCHGETNVKGYVYISMATAQIEALFHGSLPEEAAMNAARESLETCRGILAAMAVKASSSVVESHSDVLDEVMSPLGDLEGQFDFLVDGSWDFDFGEWIELYHGGSVAL
jgi:hypothetical protein